MDRIARIVTVAAAGAALATPQPSTAQGLPTLHVRDFSMSVDRATVGVGEPFHVRIVARVDEPLAALDGVVLPNLSGFEELGDERRCASVGRGTQCSETITLDATAPGEATIGPATLDAVDGRTRRPSRFATNGVTLRVAGDPLGAPGRLLFAGAAWFAIWLLSFGALLAAGLYAMRRFRRRAAAPAIAVAPVVPASPATSEADRFRALVAALEREPTRSRALAVRTALRERIGATEHETLHDLAARAALRDGEAPAMRSIERAAFCADDQLPEAVAEALPYLR